MSYSFCFGPSGAGKSRFLRKWILERARKSLSSGGKDRTKYIVVVPEQYSMQTQRELVLEDPSRVLMNVDVLSFGRLAHRVFEETGISRKSVLDDIGKSLLLRRAAADCMQELSILKKGIHRPGMIDEIKSVISEFMQYGVGEREMEAMASYAGSHGRNALEARLLDIRKLYQSFREAEKDRYVTAEETMDLLAQAIPKTKSLRGAVIVFDGFTGFTAVQYKVVTELIRYAGEVVFSFTVSEDRGPDIASVAAGSPAGGEENLFFMTRRTVRDILRMAEKEKLARGKDIYLPQRASSEEGMLLPRFKNSRVLSHLERQLFRFPNAAFTENTEGETGDSLRMFAASTPLEEVRTVFGRIAESIAETGCAYRDFAIVTADLGTYGDLFELEAARCGIPVYVDRTSGAFHNILIEGIRSVLQISSESFSYASVFRYLRSGLSRLSPEETDLLENYCLANGVRGRKKWALPFDAACEEARLRFLKEVEPVTGPVIGGPDTEAVVGSPEAENNIGQEDPETAAGDPETAADNNGTGSLDRKAGVQGRRRGRSAAERTEELYSFLVGCSAQERMAALADSFAAAGDVVREKQYSQIYRAVIDLLDQIYDLTGPEKMSAADYLELLEAGLSQIRLGTLPQRVDRVLVGDIERTRLTQIRHLFIAGVNEGSIPRSASRGGILSDMDREFLASGGAVLSPTPRQQMFIQRFYLYLNMTKPSETLTVSFSKVSRDGKSLRSSYLVSVLRDLFPLAPVEYPEMLPASSRIWNRAGGISILAELLRQFVEGAGPSESAAGELAVLYGFYTSPEVMADPETAEKVRRLRSAAMYRYRPQSLNPAAAKALYGSMLSGSISRMETAALCYLRHHLQYGLGLREREIYEFLAVDSGRILHGSLQRFDSLLRAEGLSWKSFSREDASRLAAAALREEAALYRNLLLYKSSRDESRLGRFERQLLRTVDTLQYQLLKGDFVPEAAELGFGEKPGELPPVRYDLGGGRTLKLSGRIDRVDVCVDNGRKYLRLMDYKSGPNDLDQEKIRRGLQLQLITYMETLLGISSDGLESVPSALLYYRICDPVLDESPVKALSEKEDQEKEREQQVRKMLRPTGLVYEDEESIRHLDRQLVSGRDSDVIPAGRKKGGDFTSASRLIGREEYRGLADAAAQAMCRLASDILDGNVTAAPVLLDKGSSCDYCPFREACGFDPRIPGYEKVSDR